MTDRAALAPLLPDLLAFACRLADEADQLASRAFGGPLRTETKPDGSPVTEADRAIERALRQRVADAYPQHAYFGEEEGGQLHDDVPTWVVDPIDGTKNFMRGMPVFATLISLTVAGEPVLGVASAPAMGERWTATAGGGAYRNGAPLAVSGIAELGDAHVLHGGLEWWRGRPDDWERLGRLADRAWRTRGFGDFWMHLLVAGGIADVAVEQGLKPWDVAAVACIVTEAGGRCTAWDGGSPLGDGSVLTSNGLLHPQVTALLQAPTG